MAPLSTTFRNVTAATAIAAASFAAPAYAQNAQPPAAASATTAAVTNVAANNNTRPTISTEDANRLVAASLESLRSLPRRPAPAEATRTAPAASTSSTPAATAVPANFNTNAETPAQKAARERALAERQADLLPFAKPNRQSWAMLVSRDADKGFTHLRMDETSDTSLLFVEAEINRYPDAIVVVNYIYEGENPTLFPDDCRKQREILEKLSRLMASRSDAEIVYIEAVCLRDTMPLADAIREIAAGNGDKDGYLDLVFGADYMNSFENNRFGPNEEHMPIVHSFDMKEGETAPEGSIRMHGIMLPFANVYVGGKPVDSFAYGILTKFYGGEGISAATAHNNTVRSIYTDLEAIVRDTNTMLAEKKNKANTPTTIAKAEPAQP